MLELEKVYGGQSTDVLKLMLDNDMACDGSRALVYT